MVFKAIPSVWQSWNWYPFTRLQVQSSPTRMDQYDYIAWTIPSREVTGCKDTFIVVELSRWSSKTVVRKIVKTRLGT